MKALIMFCMFMPGCITIQDIVPPFDNPDKINEQNYMKTPCFWDGTTVKKKPKVNNIP